MKRTVFATLSILIAHAGLFLAATTSLRAAPNDAPQIANPLWIVSLSDLKVTPDRPLFTPSRRAPPRDDTAPLAPSLNSNEPLQLSLIGAVVGDDDAIAVFVDKATQSIVRLRTGQSHVGWTLSAVTPREVTMKRGSEVRSLAIQREESAEAPPANAMPSPMPPPAGANSPARPPAPAMPPRAPEPALPPMRGPANL